MSSCVSSEEKKEEFKEEIRMKRKLSTLIIGSVVALSLVLTGCGSTPQKADTPPNSGNANEPVTIKVGATPVPHAELLEFVQPKLAEQGINLEIVDFTDYALPNPAVNDGVIDANFFQHTPYLDTYLAQGMKLAIIGTVHIEPMGFYSKKVTKIDELKDGDAIAIPNDPSNGGRALAVLEQAGLIKLKDGAGVTATELDIVENPKKLKIQAIEAAQLPHALTDPKIAGAVINTNYALEAGLNPTEDAIVLEGKDSPYANIVVAKEDRKNDPNLKKLVDALNSPEVKQFIEDTYKGAVVPAF